jgi:hypothetical protein
MRARQNRMALPVLDGLLPFDAIHADVGRVDRERYRHRLRQPGQRDREPTTPVS